MSPTAPTPAPTTCEEVCSNPAQAGDDEYHGVRFALKIFNEDMEPIPMNGNIFTLKVDENYYFDFSDTYDCNDRLVHLAMRRSGAPDIWAGKAPEYWCCVDLDPQCPPTDEWGECCNTGGCTIAYGTITIPQKKDCYLDSCFYSASISKQNADYPLYKSDYSFTGNHDLWIGGSAKTLGTATPPNECLDVQKFFSIEVIP